MQLSIISYSFHKLEEAGLSDIFTYLETVRFRFGLDTTDIWNGSLASLEVDYLKKVRAGLDERGLTLANLAIDKAHIWEDDPAQREQNHRNALSNLRAAEILGARTVRLDCGGPREDTKWTNEQFDAIAGRYQEYLKRAADGGYKIGPENHWGPAMAPASLHKLCQAINHPSFGVLLHFGRWHGPDAEQGDAMIAPWAMHTHIPPLLVGDDLPAAMLGLRRAGYRGCWSAEIVSVRYSELGIWLMRIRDVLETWRQES
jgi:sugar phosphate isomerase/epimerase